MTKKLHIIYIPVTGVGLHNGFKSQEWFVERIKIFLNYTFNSLRAQVNKDFILWLSFRKEEYDNPLVVNLQKHLERWQDFPVIMTFNGLMYNDDKFSNNPRTIFMNIGRIFRSWCREEEQSNTLRKVIKQTLEVLSNKKNKSLEQRLRQSLNILKSQLPEADWIYLTRIDSDDMFHKHMVQIIQNREVGYKKALTVDIGYVFNKNTSELALWMPKTNPPFHTIIFPYETFFNPDLHLDYMKGFKSHEDIRKIFNCEMLPNLKYCVLIHNNHISTIWSHPFKAPLYTGLKSYDIINIMRDFGVII